MKILVASLLMSFLFVSFVFPVYAALIPVPYGDDDVDAMQKNNVSCTFELQGYSKTGTPDPMARCGSNDKSGYVFLNSKLNGVRVTFFDKNTRQNVETVVVPPKGYDRRISVGELFVTKREAARAWIYEQIKKNEKGWDPDELRIMEGFIHPNTKLYQKNVWSAGKHEYDPWDMATWGRRGCKTMSLSGCQEWYSKKELQGLEVGTAGGKATKTSTHECKACGRAKNNRQSNKRASKKNSRLPASDTAPSVYHCPMCSRRKYKVGDECFDGYGKAWPLACDESSAGEYSYTPSCQVLGHPNFNDGHGNPNNEDHKYSCVNKAMCDVCIEGKIQKVSTDIFCRSNQVGQVDRSGLARALRPACAMTATECALDDPTAPGQREKPLYSYGGPEEGPGYYPMDGARGRQAQ